MEEKRQKEQHPELEKICLNEFGKIPPLYYKLSSHGHKNYYIEFEDGIKYVVKVYRKTGKYIDIPQDNPVRTEFLFKSEFYKKLAFKDTLDYTIFNYIHGTHIPFEEAEKMSTKLNCIKRIAEFHRIAKSSNKEDHFVSAYLWKRKDLYYEKIRKNFENSPIKDKIEKVLGHIEFFVEKVFKEYKFKDDLIYGHGDVYFWNIMWDRDNKKYVIIDYEDIGFSNSLTDVSDFIFRSTINMFSEDIDTHKKEKSKNYPKEVEIKMLIRFYLFFSRYGDKYFEISDLPECIDIYENDPNMKKITEEEIEEYYKEWPMSAALTTMKWTIWAMHDSYRTNMSMEFDKVIFMFYDFFAKFLGEMGYDVRVN